MKRILSNQCEYDQTRKIMRVASEIFRDCGFPKEFEVESVHTGDVVKFVVDQEAAMAAEFWDGEMCEYIPVDPAYRARVKKFVIYHAF